MSVPYNLLQNAVSGHIPASQRVPTIARPFLSEQAAKTLDIV
jgi:acyl-CoA dehydrogenase